MTDQQQHEHVMDLFDRVRDLHGAAREALLVSETSDAPELRLAVERLLRHDDTPDQAIRDLERGEGARLLARELALDTPLAMRGPQDAQRLGDYTIIRLIARGGMGAVYEAIQDNPRRNVALKVSSLGFASPAARRRFEFEAETLARLQHPSIAQIYAAGLAGDPGESVPFFAMELIADAQPINAHVGCGNYTTRRIVELFLCVCDAVHHGHQRGVIHRDLKPDNILVDAADRPKVIDFGVARAIHRDDGRTHTEAGQLIGTVAYMSPEQLSGNPDDLDVRTDVYSLGVVLFELLTRRLPHEIRGLPLAEVVRRVGQTDAILASRANPRLKGDLEFILAKALARRTVDRYASVGDFSADLRRFLSFEPVSARAPSRVYRFTRFALRNKAAVAAAGVILIALVSATGISAQAAARASAALADSRESAARAAAVSTFLTRDLVAAANPEQGGNQKISLADAIRSALPKIDASFAESPDIAAELHFSVGEMLMMLADHANARAEALRAIERATAARGAGDRTTLAARSLLGKIETGAGRNQEALEILEPLLEDVAKQPEADPRLHADVLTGLGDALNGLWRSADAERAFRAAHSLHVGIHGADDVRAVRSLSRVASAVYSQKRPDEAAKLVEQVLSAELKASKPSPDHIADAQHTLATMYCAIQRYDEAEPLFQACIDSLIVLRGEQHPALADTMYQYSRLKLARKDLEAALQLNLKSLPILRNSYGEEHEFVPRTLNLIAHVYSEMKDFAAAEPYYRESEALYRKTRGLNSSAVVISTLNVGVNQYDQGRAGDALPHLLEARERAARVVAAGDVVIPAAIDLALARCYAALSRATEAESHFRAVLELKGEPAAAGTVAKAERELDEFLKKTTTTAPE